MQAFDIIKISGSLDLVLSDINCITESIASGGILLVVIRSMVTVLVRSRLVVGIAVEVGAELEILSSRVPVHN